MATGGCVAGGAAIGRGACSAAEMRLDILVIRSSSTGGRRHVTRGNSEAGSRRSSSSGSSTSSSRERRGRKGRVRCTSQHSAAVSRCC